MMSGMCRNLACAVLAAAALVVAGCGSSDDDAAPTRAQYIARVDTLCQASNQRTRALNVRLRRAAAGARDDRERLRRLAPVLERGHAGVRKNAAVFKAADAPAGDAAAVERIAKAYGQQAEQVRELAAAARRGNVRAFISLSDEQDRLVTRARRLAREYGFRECGSLKSDGR